MKAEPAVGPGNVADDLDSAQWLVQSLKGGSGESLEVRALVPTVFARYARLLHPAYRVLPDGEQIPVSWAAIGQANGRSTHPQVQFPNLSGVAEADSFNDADELMWNEPPLIGTLPAQLAGLLSQILARHTKTPDRCFFGLWEGFSLAADYRSATSKRLELPDRRYLLFRGPIVSGSSSVSVDSFQAMNLWWPEGREWFVATDIDLSSTYIGGTVECIEELLQDPHIEALLARPEHGISFRADQINPLPGHGCLEGCRSNK